LGYILIKETCIKHYIIKINILLEKCFDSFCRVAQSGFVLTLQKFAKFVKQIILE